MSTATRFQEAQWTDPDGDDAWDRVPTALEQARYDDHMRREADAEARRKAAQAEAARTIFGDCLRKIIELGVRQGQARSMLGKWRAATGDDALLVRIVDHAHRTGTPDPIGYVTKAIEKARSRASDVDDMSKGRWVELGWEAPTLTASGPRFRSKVRGRVWRDPFGKIRILPPEEGTVPPTLDDEPGVKG